MVNVLKGKTSRKNGFKNIDEGKINEPVLGEEGQFARQKGVRYGQVSVQKDRIEFDDGTQVILRFSGTSGIEAAGTFGNVWSFYDEIDGTEYGSLGFLATDAAFVWMSLNDAGIWMDSSDFAWISSDNSEEIALFGDADIAAIAETTVSLSAKGNVTLLADSDDDDSGAVYLKGAATEEAQTSGVFIYDHDEEGSWELLGNGTATKTAVIPTTKGYRALYCTESPEVWFMDFCNAKKRKWWQFWKKEKWNVALDPLFKEVTEPPYVIMPSLNPDVVQVWGKRKGQADKRFEKKTKKEFEKNNKFWSQDETKKD